MADKPLPTTRRGGTYFRVYKPDWLDPTDTGYAKASGGRWNPVGEFGALYLNATLRVAAAQARFQHQGRAIGLFDLRPERRPMLADIPLPPMDVVDAVEAPAVRALRLPATYPYNVPWEPCQRIARRAFRNGLAGVAARSNAEATPRETVGEELAYFDSQPALAIRERRSFDDWYPDPRP